MHNKTVKDGVESISVFFPGQRGRSASENHPNYAEIVRRLEADKTDATVMELFDVEQTVRDRFETLSERVTVKGGKLFLDGMEAHNSLADQIIRFLYGDVDDWKPLVKFYENLLSNPNKHSREQLYTWLDQHKFVIDEDGYLIGYKYVTDRGDGNYTSTMSGYGIVDGVEYTSSYLPYKVGCVATMPRDKVQHDPSKGCSFGLHVGTWNYAASASRTVLRVRVNPRDVVSVPTDCSWAKLRCCRFEVVDAEKVEIQDPIAYYGKPEADELPRLIPASEWKREHAAQGATAEVSITDAPQVVDPVGYQDDSDPIKPLGQFLADTATACGPGGVPRIDLSGGLTVNPAYRLDTTPRVDSVTTYVANPHDLREDDDGVIEAEYCGDCGEEEDDCTCDDDSCYYCDQSPCRCG